MTAVEDSRLILSPSRLGCPTSLRPAGMEVPLDMSSDINVILTMDCEPALFECSPLAIELSGTGPATYQFGESSIRGYVESSGQGGLSGDPVRPPRGRRRPASAAARAPGRRGMPGDAPSPIQVRHRSISERPGRLHGRTADRAHLRRIGGVVGRIGPASRGSFEAVSFRPTTRPSGSW